MSWILMQALVSPTISNEGPLWDLVYRYQTLKEMVLAIRKLPNTEDSMWF